MFALHPHDPPSVGPYLLHARLGEDSSARVYLASVPGAEPVAVKVVRPEYTTDANFRAAFRRLVEQAHELNSPYLGRVRAADLEGAVPWVAISRPPGPSLADLVRERGPLPADALHPLALAVAQGLADLHATGRVHAALWPDGILLSAEHALIADPGLERAVPHPEGRAPHPSFVAPEGGATPATDVFSWAATLSLAAGGVEGPEGLPKVPLQLRGLVEACLKQSPALRPSAADLVRMLGGPTDPPPWSSPVRAAVGEVEQRQRRVIDESVRAAGTRTGPEVSEETRRPSGRGRTITLGAGVLALLLVAGVGTLWGVDQLLGAPDSTQGAKDEPMLTDAGCLDGTGYPEPEGLTPGKDDEAYGLAFSPDGDALVVTSRHNGTVLWDWRAKEPLAQLADEASPGVDPTFAPTGCFVAAAESITEDDVAAAVAHTYDVPTGTSTEHHGPQQGPDDSGTWHVDPRTAEHVIFSPSGQHMAVSLESSGNADSVGVIDTSTGEQVNTVASGPAYYPGFVDDQHLIVNEFDTLHVLDTTTGETEATVQGVTETRFGVVPGTDEVVHVDQDSLRWWDYTEGAEVISFDFSEYARANLPTLLDVTVDAPAGRVYVSWFDVPEGGGDKEHTVHVFDRESGEDLAAGKDQATDFLWVAVHPDGETLAVVDLEYRVTFVDPKTLQSTEQLY